jgi:hypothetical protein
MVNGRRFISLNGRRSLQVSKGQVTGVVGGSMTYAVSRCEGVIIQAFPQNRKDNILMVMMMKVVSRGLPTI